MKEKSLKYLTVSALVVVGLLQLVWVFHTYDMQRRDIKIKADDLFFEAIERELYPRVDGIAANISESDTLTVDANLGFGQKVNDLISFQELCIKYNSEISLDNLDSIFDELLKENNISMKTSTHFIRFDSLETNRFPKACDNIVGAVGTDPIPIRKDGSLYIHATLSDPYKTILTRMAFLVAGTIIMMLFVAYCIILQIRIIVRQNRIAQLRQDFSYAMIHDMKTPLTSILVGTRVLESGKLDDNPDKRQGYFRIMKDEIDHLLTLVNKILTIAKLESREIVLEKQLIPMGPMIEDLVEKFSVKESKEIEFIVHVSRESVYADAEYLKEAISNLIDNAIKYSGESVRIEITCQGKGEYSQISVKDNGFGISIKDQSLIFEKFERGAATRRSSKGGATGFGLGLSYVQQVTAAHGGKVEIDSIKEEYSEFIICLPRLMEELT